MLSESERETIKALQQIGTWLRDLIEWHKEAEQRKNYILERQAQALEIIVDKLDIMSSAIEARELRS